MEVFPITIAFICCLLVNPAYFKAVDQSSRAEVKCGYDSCPQTFPGKLNVHIVPHSHDDVGWLKTVDQYYYGSQTRTQKAGVQYILDSTIQELLRDARRRFIYVESAFFFKWWHEQTEELQEKVKRLVNEGRLEFVGGGWSMNDEASTHYQSIVDQFTLGLRFLNDTFGECARPRVGWQIDPFGHSREMASIFAEMGFDGQFFARLDYEEKQQRLDNKTAEMIWQSIDSLGSSSDIFTGVLYNHYSSPPGFCFDVLCNDEPIIDGKHSPDNNVDRKLLSFSKYLQKMKQYYKTNHLMIPMGDDFHYQDANMWFKNLDKLIRYANERPTTSSEMHLLYSTPSCYLKSLQETSTTWPVKTQDFFPYSSDATAFWTGYFTSRPTLKYFERIGNHFLQICKQLTAAEERQDIETNVWRSSMLRMRELQEAMGIMQHHDAITGTEKAVVASDYARILSEGIEECGLNVRSALNGGAQKKGGQLAKFGFESCLGLNMSSCEVPEKSSKFMVTVYNVLGHKVSQYARIPVQDVKYIVTDSDGKRVQTQMVPIPESVRKIHNRFSVALYELVFLASNVPANGFRSYYIEIDPADVMVPEVVLIRKPRSESTSTVIRNDEVDVAFDSQGQLASVSANGVTHSIQQRFLYYRGAAGNNQGYANRSSGAYIFRPNGTEHLVTDDVELHLFQGPLVDEVHQKFNDWITQVVRVYKAMNYVEFEWLVGSIPVDDGYGKEVISRFTSDLKTKGTFFTDSNGRQTLTRVRNQRPDYELHLNESIAGNYYPVTTKIAIEDDNARLAVLTDRAQGGSSLQDGAIELMVHRRLLYDDGFGVSEALDSKEFGRGVIARGKHYLMLGPKNSNIREKERQLQLEKTLPLWLFFSELEDSITFEEWTNAYIHEKSLWPIQLPPNIHLMTLEPLGANKLLLRFEHILEQADDPITQAALNSSSSGQSSSVTSSSPGNPSSTSSSLSQAEEELPTSTNATTNMGSSSQTKSTPSTFGVLPITFDISDFLKRNGYSSTSTIRRTTLGGNLWLDNMKRLEFNKDDNGDKLVSGSGDIKNAGTFGGSTTTNSDYEDGAVSVGVGVVNITLKPMEIATFIVERKESS